MPTPSRAEICLETPWWESSRLFLLFELPELDDKAELEGTFLMLSKYLAIFSSVSGKVFLGM
jgi:hypothetical protein